ncbi:MAG: hypothetical protein MHM6MM_008289 [Cercozoa sp. M6MM]
MDDKESVERERQRLLQELNTEETREEIRNMLREMLTEEGWYDRVRADIRAEIEENGLMHATVDSISTSVLEKATNRIPAHVRNAVVHKLQEALTLKQADEAAKQREAAAADRSP